MRKTEPSVKFKFNRNASKNMVSKSKDQMEKTESWHGREFANCTTA